MSVFFVSDFVNRLTIRRSCTVVGLPVAVTKVADLSDLWDGVAEDGATNSKKLAHLPENGMTTTSPLFAPFNTHVDNTFNPSIIRLFHEASKTSFCWRRGKEKWEHLTVEVEERARKLDAFKASLGELAKWYSDGPFTEDENPLYADFILGGWLRFMSVAMPVKEWEDGLWGRLHRALEKYAEVK
ncbi:hypothetical protein C8R44DRAFT_729567 [Mycena epipterygia]|nr:hypothetical protein C8R44DRAFT_729567 [Mycena epipterygia]